ncbi:ketopantoate reductase family protein [Humibacter ginsenosidimutans]|uniref:2-dehydropantoate 2-reductase n=1 Tax=Humibacter ginsenosidimutans TaxID=2599293 RepID=A0A5B8M153_9MICO|nr:2-dehydropantoate 2-reductase [Humibacter ginsenosidimutans]QDZ13442.1 2-dehydropantoate 2-reductase [Humibacter ginsenosidimutans]
MRIGIIGTGAIGGTIAALLDRAGHQVSVTARGEGLAAIAEHGLRFDGAWGEHVATVTASETLVATPDLAFVCTKAQDASAALRENAEHLRGITVVIVQNGLEALEVAAGILPDAELVGALALYASQYVEPGHVTVTATGSTYLGAGAGEPSDAARSAAGILGQVMPAFATPNFLGAQWTKLVVNMVNAMPALTGLSVQQTIADRRLSRVVTASMRETTRIGFASGVRYATLQGLSNPLLRVFSALPLWAARSLPTLMARRMGSVPNLGSTLQSRRRGRTTEIDYLNGAVVRAAAAIGRPAPVNAAIVEAMQGLEPTGEFLTPEQGGALPVR